MSASDSHPPAARPPRAEFPRFQFSMKWLLIAVTVVAVLFGLLSLGNAFAGLLWVILFVVLPTPLLIIAIFARGDLQAFSIGALLVWAAISLSGFQHGWPLSEVAGKSISMLLLGSICGAVAVATRRWIGRGGGNTR